MKSGVINFAELILRHKGILSKYFERLFFFEHSNIEERDD